MVHSSFQTPPIPTSLSYSIVEGTNNVQMKIVFISIDWSKFK